MADRDGEVLRATQDAATSLAVLYRNMPPRARREIRDDVYDAFEAVEKARLALLDEGDDASADDVREAQAIRRAMSQARRRGDIAYQAKRLIAFAAKFAL